MSDLELQHYDARQEHMNNSLFSEKNFLHYMQVAETLAKSTLVPKNMQNKPSDILIAMELGNTLGIPYMQSLQDVAVINGRPTLYGDALLSVVQGHKDYEWIKEVCTDVSATCTIKRRNHEPHTTVFTKEDAQKSKLWGKQGPWLEYAKRMLQMRARGFCIRDIFADALRGVKTAEEVQDYQIIDSEPQKKVTAADCLKGLLERKAEPINAIPLVLASDAQCEAIVSLIESTGFSDERLIAALEYYDAGDIGDLSVKQADDFITKLSGLK